MIYTLRDQTRRIDIIINHISMMERKKNPPTDDDERVELELAGGSKFILNGQDAKDFFQDWRNLIEPALGGIINP